MLPIKIKQHLAVRAGFQAHSRRKPLRQFAVIVDLAVGDQNEILVVTDQGLAAVFRIDQGEPGESETDGSLAQAFPLVRSTVVKCLGQHGEEYVCIRTEVLPVDPDGAANATHEGFLRLDRYGRWCAPSRRRARTHIAERRKIVLDIRGQPVDQVRDLRTVVCATFLTLGLAYFFMRVPFQWISPVRRRTFFPAPFLMKQ
ncbi:hypothetical protein BJY16_002502 [Actinoplanes octamycinicus]|uniref:Uncharacterized protein n=1 Tax=Actinoplanes octamycinicus TaxID=135948 RepID=A0A7W7GVI7_9ACTN|nr:hypothetical protein [Actinoplanes octamycinicus]GIE60174.1 hypothetical protein Aoc01nite_55760 [Actinoplanes octamycinicus]